MGIPDGAHIHGSGGSGLGTAVLVILGAALAVKLAAPVVAAAAELVHVLLVIVVVVLAVGAVGLVALLAWRWRHRRPDAARAIAVPPYVARAARPLPEPPRPAIEQAPQVHVHHHWHGVSAEDVATILRQPQLPGHPVKPRE